MYSYEHKGDSTQDGVGSYPDQRSRTSYSSPPSSDHVHRPVLLDAEGRKWPVVSFDTPRNGGYFVQKSDVVRTVHSPVVSSENKEGMPTRVEPTKTHGQVTEDRSGMQSSPVHRHVEDKRTPYPDPANGYGKGANGFPDHRPLKDKLTPHSVHANGYGKDAPRSGTKVPHESSPSVTDYKGNPMGRDGQVKTYGGVPEEKWSKPSSPVRHPVEDKHNAYPNHANNVQVKTYGGNQVEKWSRPSSPGHSLLEDNRKTYPNHTNGVPTKAGVPEEKWSRASSPSHSLLEDNRKTYPIHANSVSAKTYGGVPEEKWGRPSSPSRHPLEDNRKTYPNHANSVSAMTYGGVPEEKWSRPSSPSRRPLEDNRKTYLNYANGVPAKTYDSVTEEKWSNPSSPSRRPLEDNRKTYPNHANGVPEERWNRPSIPSHRSLEDNRKAYPNYANSVPAKTYSGVPEEIWSRPSSPSHRPLEDNRKTYPNHFNGVPTNTYGDIPEEKWSNHAIPNYRPLEDERKAYPNHVNGGIANPPLVSDYKQSSPPRSYPVQPHRPSSPTNYHSNPDHKIDEYIKKIQAEVSPPRFGPLSATYWRKTHQTTIGYGPGDDLGHKVGHAPSEPPMVTSGGWSRPSHATWASPPEGTLTHPTNDINAAVHFLLEAAKPSSSTYPPSSSATMPFSNGSRPNSYGAPIIDNREVARRYGNFSFSSRYQTIDSKEAARKYGGTNV